MKSETKKIIFFLFLAVAYFSQAFTDAFEFSFVYFFGFMLAVAILYIIKNIYIGTLAGLVLLSAMEFYDTDYKQLTIIPFLLICAHKHLITDTGNNSKGKKNTSSFYFVCVQLSIFATIALFIYDFILISNNHPSDAPSTLFSRTTLILLWFVGMFVYSVVARKSNKLQTHTFKMNKALSGNLGFMYLVSILAFMATVLFCFIRVKYMNISYHAIYFPWFIYICSMVYNGDPYIKSLAESIGNLLTKISYKDKVKE